jgi:hypothetical protein
LFARIRAVVTAAILAEVTAAHDRFVNLRIRAWLRTLTGVLAVIVARVVLFLDENMRVDRLVLSDSSHEGKKKPASSQCAP